MPPNQTDPLLMGAVQPDKRNRNKKNDTEYDKQSKADSDNEVEEEIPEQHILWSSVFIFIVLHTLTLYMTMKNILHMKFLTMIWAFCFGWLAIFGVTAGVHRLWSHRSYKAKAPLRLILSICYAIAAQYPPWDWVRDHRVHHKYSDTNCDPHNARRGLFYSHIGWLIQSKHPEVVKKEKQVNMSDIIEDKIFMTFTRYYSYFGTTFGFVIPILVPMVVWNESFECALTAALIRYICTIHITFSINSFAHHYGYRPYKKDTLPRESLAEAIITLGEGWHNYHHTFPWDYRAAELGGLFKVNPTLTALNFFNKIGWAYDMKVASPEIVAAISKKYGDGSRINEIPYPGN